MHKAIVLSAAALALTAASAAPAAASAPPAGNRFLDWIEVVSSSGAGCPSNTVSAQLTDDHGAFRLYYGYSGDYKVQAGGSSQPLDFRKTCKLSLKMHTSLSNTYAITGTDYRLTASLQSGAQAILRANYLFQGSTQIPLKTYTINGPATGNFQHSDSVPQAQLVWAPCGEQQDLVVNTELRVNKGSDGSKVSSASLNHSDNNPLIQTYHLTWKTCP